MRAIVYNILHSYLQLNSQTYAMPNAYYTWTRADELKPLHYKLHYKLPIQNGLFLID